MSGGKKNKFFFFPVVSLLAIFLLLRCNQEVAVEISLFIIFSHSSCAKSGPALPPPPFFFFFSEL